jgi:hypothetical protein
MTVPCANVGVQQQIAEIGSTKIITNTAPFSNIIHLEILTFFKNASNIS